jgi:DNA (cytosine-5)-methyltransferase 1
MVNVYYNEFDPFAAAWLQKLMDADLIPSGVIDTRSIHDVQPEDVIGYDQCHFFAGIGGWAYALRLSNWGDRPVWTGSPPCQPYSTAGKQKGKNDDRHLFPEWFRLIKECKPDTIFGEEVSSAIAFGWLDDAFNDLEAEGYTCGAAVLPACSVGAPHKRDRLWFVGNAEHDGQPAATQQGSDRSSVCDNAKGAHCTSESAGASDTRNVPTAMGNPNSTGLQGQWGLEQQHDPQGREATKRHHWSSGVYINCPDGKSRLIEPTIPLLADGLSNRMGVLRGIGNAIVPQVAAQFVNAFMEI